MEDGSKEETRGGKMIKTIGSLCSGIESGTVAWYENAFEYKWYSEIANFPNRVLGEKYPGVPNLGDMVEIPEKIMNEEIEAPDMICGGTPCQAFSFAGFQSGLNDDRGNLTLSFIDVINANDTIRKQKELNKTVVFWENVEGVLSDKTNAFGCFISYLAGLDKVLEVVKWPKAGLLKGPQRNVAWRVIDAKFFGVPQQRKRLYVLAGGKDFFPENVLFEEHTNNLVEYPSQELCFEKDNHKFEVFREYTDCLYAAYGTKWNGNAAANNGSLFVVQDDRLRRLSPLECERLMGFEDNYTDLTKAKRTERYTAIGNAWAVPVIKWIGDRFNKGFEQPLYAHSQEMMNFDNYEYFDLGKGICELNGAVINCSTQPENPRFGSMKDIVSHEGVEEKLYITPVACHGIIRRGGDRVNPRLKEVMLGISSQMSLEEIEKQSRKQPRGDESGMAKLTKRIKEENK